MILIDISISFRYLTRLKSDITYVFSHDYANIKIDSDHDIPLEKTLTIHNVVMRVSQQPGGPGEPSPPPHPQ